MNSQQQCALCASPYWYACTVGHIGQGRLCCTVKHHIWLSNIHAWCVPKTPVFVPQNPPFFHHFFTNPPPPRRRPISSPKNPHPIFFHQKTPHLHNFVPKEPPAHFFTKKIPNGHQFVPKNPPPFFLPKNPPFAPFLYQKTPRYGLGFFFGKVLGSFWVKEMGGFFGKNQGFFLVNFSIPRGFFGKNPGGFLCEFGFFLVQSGGFW